MVWKKHDDYFSTEVDGFVIHIIHFKDKMFSLWIYKDKVTDKIFNNLSELKNYLLERFEIIKFPKELN